MINKAYSASFKKHYYDIDIIEATNTVIEYSSMKLKDILLNPLHGDYYFDLFYA